jgi:hypothetical protein
MIVSIMWQNWHPPGQATNPKLAEYFVISNTMRKTGVLLTVISLGILLSTMGHGQSLVQIDSGRLFFISASAHRGTIVVQDENAAYLVQKKTKGLQLDLSVLKNTQRTWDYCNCYSKSGVSLSYVDFGNPVNLGHAINFAAYVEPYLSFSHRLQFSFRGGAGFAYLNRTFNAVTNPDNTFYSRKVSFLLLLNLNVYYALTPSLRASLTAQFSHISNGGARDPNWGINFPAIGVGLEYMLRPEVLKPRMRKPFTDRSIKVITTVFGGRRLLQANDPWPDQHRLIAGINTGVVKPLGRISAIGLGAELYYDGTSHLREVRYQQKYSDMIGAISLQHYFFFGKIVFGQQMAYQVTRLNPDVYKHFYQRFLLGYQLRRHWYGGITLKSHGDVSENLSFVSMLVF